VVGAHERHQGNRADEALRKRFQTEEQQAVDAQARWIGHPAVRGIIERRRVGAGEMNMPAVTGELILEVQR
jgi:hypothetical protein